MQKRFQMAGRFDSLIVASAAAIFKQHCPGFYGKMQDKPIRKSEVRQAACRYVAGCAGKFVGRFVGSGKKSRFTEKRKNPRNHCGFKDFSGAAGQIRTADLVITNDALYRLSYSSMFVSQTARLL